MPPPPPPPDQPEGFRVTGEVEREDYDSVLTPERDRTLEAGLRPTRYVIETPDEVLIRPTPGVQKPAGLRTGDFGARERERLPRRGRGA
jgi:hypothetical protein